jgi:hypothetical protein
MPDKHQTGAENTATLPTNTSASDANTDALKPGQHAKPEVKAEPVKVESVPEPEVKIEPTEPETKWPSKWEREQERVAAEKLAAPKLVVKKVVVQPVVVNKLARDDRKKFDVQTSPPFASGVGVVRGPSVSLGGVNNHGPWFKKENL